MGFNFKGHEWDLKIVSRARKESGLGRSKSKINHQLESKIRKDLKRERGDNELLSASTR